MEMVSAAKSKKLVDRLNTAKPYKEKLLEMIAALGREEQSISSPYLRRVKELHRAALLVVSANRGLCGAYNSNILGLAKKRYEELSSQGIKCDVYAIGKKGRSYFKFVKIDLKEAYVDIDENFSYSQSEKLCMDFMRKFRDQLYDKIEIVSAAYHSAGSQKAACIEFLPPGLGLSEVVEEKKETRKENYIFEPDAKSIVEALIPLSIRTHFYGILLEAMCSEQIARRVAMKNATDSAGEMLKSLVRSYNRARQASITQELAEIVAGADAI